MTDPRVLIATLCMILGSCSECFAEQKIKLATTTSLYETGILEHILEPFEVKNKIRVRIISVGTGKAIKLGENGDVDVIMVHAKEAEEKFLRDGHGINRRRIMQSDFVILGPKEDPAQIAGLKDAKEALTKIYYSESLFISRGDDSGTDRREKLLWAKTDLSPSPTWYMEAGQGMSATLRLADEKNAYVLTDRPTYLFNTDSIRLSVLVEGDEDLTNPYSIIAVNPDKHPHVKYELVANLIKWMTSPECQKIIDAYKVKGNRLFVASAKE